MNSEDRSLGRIVSRRQALTLLAAAGAGLLLRRFGAPMSGAQAAPASVSACVVRPEQTEGPYFVDRMLERSDIRSDPASGVVSVGIPLQLTFNIWRLTQRECVPLAGATVDIWHCDANGVYSDARDPRFSTVGKRFLRGYQPTDAQGRANFTTVYPGWYDGRTTHIHFKIRTGTAGEQRHEFTSQLYFDDAFTDAVYSRAPYSARGPRTRRNRGDGIFRDGGAQLMLSPTPRSDGYQAAFDIALNIA